MRVSKLIGVEKSGGVNLTDRQLFRLIGFDQVVALDAHLYEGADISHDLNEA